MPSSNANQKERKHEMTTEFDSFKNLLMKGGEKKKAKDETYLNVLYQ